MLSLLNHSLNELATSTRFHQFIASSGFHAHCSPWICLVLCHVTTIVALTPHYTAKMDKQFPCFTDKPDF